MVWICWKTNLKVQSCDKNLTNNMNIEHIWCSYSFYHDIQLFSVMC